MTISPTLCNFIPMTPTRINVHLHDIYIPTRNFSSLNLFSSGNHLFFFVYINVFLSCYICLYFSFWIPHINELIKYLSLSDFCHLACLWSIQVITYGKISFFYDWVIHTHTHIYHIFLQSSIGGNLGCLHISATVNNTVNISYNERSSAYFFFD